MHSLRAIVFGNSPRKGAGNARARLGWLIPRWAKLVERGAIALCLAAFCLPLLSQGRIAVQPPVLVGTKIDPFYGRQLRGVLEEAVVGSGTYKVVDRARIDQIQKEQGVQSSGLVKDSQIKGIGKMLGADFLLVSEVQLSESRKKLNVTCSLLDVETAEVAKTASVTCEYDEDAFETACQILMQKLALGRQNAVQAAEEAPSGGAALATGPAPQIVDGAGIELALIPAGGFTMGEPRPASGRQDEKPSFVSTFAGPFYMGRYPVTQGQYEKVMGANPSGYQGENLPVEKVTWEDATLFCKYLSQKEGALYRLPTEAEWEYACRAGSMDEPTRLGEIAWTSENSGGKTHQVGLKEPNAWGLYDMLGNVGEWCQDWYGDYTPMAKADPTGPASGRERVVRGGCYAQDSDRCRPAARTAIPPGQKYDFVGFRVVRAVAK